MLVLSKDFLEIQANIECGFTLKRVRDIKRTYSQCTVQVSIYYSAQSFDSFRNFFCVC